MLSESPTIQSRRRDPFPLEGDWDAGRLLCELRRADVTLTDRQAAELRDFFWFDLCAEYDSRHLHDRLKRDSGTYSNDFRAMEAAWYRDEQNHTRGFLELYCRLYGERRDLVERRLARREPDFAALEPFLGDELRLCLLLAYDELATSRAYHVDVALYRRMGAPILQTWIRRLIRDERYHHQNAVEVLRRRHLHRLDEAPRHIADFVEYDLGDHRYRATFLFDHEWDVDAGFYSRNGEILEASLRRLAGSEGSRGPDAAE